MRFRELTSELRLGIGWLRSRKFVCASVMVRASGLFTINKENTF